MKKAAIIGLGDIAAIHLAAILANPQIQLCGVCDSDEKRAAAAPQNVPFYSDYKEMVRQEKPDCVHICLPHYLHYPVAKELVEMGCHVFCEKPVAMNTKEAEQFAALEEAYPEQFIGICLQNRCNESVELLKELIDSGEYGRITGIRGFVPWFRNKGYYDVKPWRGQMDKAGGGCMINQSVHTLDLMYYLAGDIKGLKASVSQLCDFGIEVEDTVSARIDFANGAAGMFFATNGNFENESVQLSIRMEKGLFRIQENQLYKIEADGKAEKLIEDKRMPGSKFYYGASHSKLIGRFYEGLEENQKRHVRVRDAVMSIRLIDAIVLSGKTNNYVEIN